MAARVFVVERVVEQRLALAYGRVLRNERNLAQAAGALVGVEDALQHVGTNPRTAIDHAATLKTQPEVIHIVACMDKRKRRVHNAVGMLAMRRGEDLLGRDVGEERVPVRRLAAPARPDMAVGKPNGKIRAIRGLIAERREVVFVQKPQVLLERRVVQLPRALWVFPIRARNRENGAP